MKVDVTRDVILDLLPLYLSGEVSDDTRALVEQFLAADAKLAYLVEQTAEQIWPQDIPTPINKESEMKAFEKTKRLMFQQNLFLALAIFMTLVFVAFRFTEEGRVEWLWIDAPQLGGMIFMVATLFWIAFGNVTYSLNQE